MLRKKKYTDSDGVEIYSAYLSPFYQQIACSWSGGHGLRYTLMLKAHSLCPKEKCQGDGPWNGETGPLK